MSLRGSVSGVRALALGAALALALLAALALAGRASASGPLTDDGGASWRLEQPLPPPPPPGVEGATTPVGLGHVGDVEFWAPNRGVLITAGNGSTVPPGVWAYDGRTWHELANVCGGSDGRIAWAGPDDFWTVSDGRPGQAADAHGEPPPLKDNTLCHFSGGKVVASYASLAFTSTSYQAMHGAGCISPNDCWFAGDPLPAPQVGSFHLHWDGSTVSEVPYTASSDPVGGLTPFEGQLFESPQLLPPLGSEETALRAINPNGISPTFQTQPEPSLYGGGEFPTALQALRLSSADEALWAAAGAVPETPAGSAEGQVTVGRYAGGAWTQLLGPATEPSGATLFGTAVVEGLAAEPGTGAAWLALDSRGDSLTPSPTATALVARIDAGGQVSGEDLQNLPSGGEAGPKGGSSRIACPAAHECWLATTQGWLFHLTTGEALAQDTDPAFASLITERPADEGVPQITPDAPPPDDSGLLGEPPPALTTIPETKQKSTVTVPLLSHVRSRLVAGTTLELRFHLAVKARIRLVAKRRKAVVARTPMHTFKAGERKLLLKLDPHRWPTKLQLDTHALAPLPTVSLNQSNTQTVSTRMVVLPHVTPFDGAAPR